MRSLAQELAVQTQPTKAVATPMGDRGLPIRTTIDYPTPLPVAGFVEDGQVIAGHELNGLALPQRVIATLGRPEPHEYVVIGEERYSDGRWYLAFAVSSAWVEHNAPACQLCGGKGGVHDRVEYDDEETGKRKRTACPNDPRPARRRRAS